MKKLLKMIGATTIVGVATITASLSVIGCSNSNPLTPQEYLNRIKNTKFSLASPVIDSDASDPNTADVITAALVKNNPALGSFDVAKSRLHYSGNLNPGSFAPIEVTATIDTKSAHKSINVKADSSTAQQYLDRIKNSQFTIKDAFAKFNSDNAVVSQFITSALVNHNPALGPISEVVQILTYSGNLKPNSSALIVVKATLPDNSTAQKTINVTWEARDPDDYAKSHIKNRAITISGPSSLPTDPDNTSTKPLISQALIDVNPDLGSLAAVEQILSFTGTLRPNESAPIQATITIGNNNSHFITIQVKWNESLINFKNVLSGYWFNWHNDHADMLNIGNINPVYNVINVAFYAGSQKTGGLPVLDPNITNAKQSIISGIAEQHAEGHKVMLSMGGANGESHLTAQNIGQFESNTMDIIKTYGFDGLDIDWEGQSALQPDNATYIIQAVKYFKQHDSKFMLTMAPEFSVMRKNASGSIYPKIIDDLQGYYNYIQPQFYNQGGDGISVSPEDQKTFGVPSWLAQNNMEHHAAFLYLIAKYMVHPWGTFNKFPVIPADQLVLGLPATPTAAGSGYTKPSVLEDSYTNYFKKYNLNIHGLMTWAVNYDARNNWEYADQSYANTWGRA